MKELEMAEIFIKDISDNFKKNNHLNSDSRFLFVVLRAQKAGTYLDEKNKRKYSVGSDEDELQKIIKEARTELISWEAAEKIFQDLTELQKPIPKSLAQFIICSMKGDVKRPRKSQVWNNKTRNLAINHIANMAMNKFPELPVMSSDNRIEESICGILAQHFHVTPAAIRKVINQKARKST